MLREFGMIKKSERLPNNLVELSSINHNYGRANNVIVNNRTGVGDLISPSISFPFDFQNVLLLVKYDMTVKLYYVSRTEMVRCQLNSI